MVLEKLPVAHLHASSPTLSIFYRAQWQLLARSLWAERVAAAPARATNGQSQPRCVASCRTALPLPLLHYQVLMVVLFAVRGFFLEPNVLSGKKRGITVTSARNPS